METLSFISGVLAQLALMVAMVWARPACGAEPITIPLDQVWALNMPGTRDILKLDPVPTILGSISRPLLSKLPKEQPAQGFAVQGSSDGWLRQACGILVDGKSPSPQFTTKDEVSIVFFSYAIDQYVHLVRVERDGTAISIHYRFEPHDEKEVVPQIAIIPLGKLPSGDYNVDVINVPMEQRFVEMRYVPIPKETAKQIVSRPFNFVVVEKAGN